VIKVFKLVRNLFLIGLIAVIISTASLCFAEEITLTTIMPSGGGASLGDMVLVGNLLATGSIDDNLTFVTQSDGFMVINTLSHGGTDGWIELELDTYVFGSDGANEDRILFAKPGMCSMTLPIKNGTTCKITKKGFAGLGVSVYWTPLGS